MVFPGKASGQLVCQGGFKDIMCESQAQGHYVSELGIFSRHKWGKKVPEGDGN